MSAVVERADQVREQYEVELETLRRDRTLGRDERRRRIYELWQETRRVLSDLKHVEFEAERKERWNQLVSELGCFPDGATVNQREAALERIRSSKVTDEACARQLRTAVEENNEVYARAVIGEAVARGVVQVMMINTLRRLRPDDYDLWRELRAQRSEEMNALHSKRGTWSCTKPMDLSGFKPPAEVGRNA